MNLKSTYQNSLKFKWRSTEAMRFPTMGNVSRALGFPLDWDTLEIFHNFN